MAIIEIGEKNFKEKVEKGTNIVYLTAPWCGPCKMLGPVMEELNTEYEEVEFYKVDVDNEPNLASNLGVMSVPTLLLYKNGEVVSEQIGFAPKEILSKWIEAHK